MKKKTLSKVFLLVGLTFALENVSYSISSPQNNSDREMQLQEKRLEEKRIKNILKKELQEKEKVKEKEDVQFQSGRKFYIKQITLINANKLSVKEKIKIVKKYAKKDLGMGDIHNLVKDITNSYIKKGYVAARVTLPINQNISQGELKLKIFEGKIEKVLIIDRSKNKSKLKENLNLVFKEGDTVNLKKIEYSEANLSSAPNTQGKFKLNPGTKIGQTIIIGDVHETKLGSVNVDFDNLGSEGTGKNSVKVGMSTGNVLGASDTLFVQGSSTLDDDSVRYSRSVFADYTLPIGWWETGVTYNYSQTRNTIPGKITSSLNESKSSSAKFKLNRTLYDGSKGKIKLGSTFAFKDSKTFIEKSFVETSSYKSASEQIDLSYSGILAGGSIFNKLSYVRGLGSLGADKDKYNSQAKRQYDKFKFYTRYYKPFTFMNLGLAYEFTFDSQYSPDILYSGDKMSIGDDVTVRGFKDGVTGEKGIYVKNQLNYTFLTESKNPIARQLNQTKFYVGIDYGFVKNSSNKNNPKYLSNEEIASVAFGLYKDISFANISVSCGIPIYYPDYLEVDKKGRIYLTGSMSF
ncbi:MAG: ShlB/FhaC/HecB family hemolysin secretion/activation protein [Fusobacterium sp. JB021]|nr:ShlB/FhaC/HecB family hemolysin secretion/activation protein [Fusobacterium sp. JB021]MDP0507193.1 ShlB/FhaC/HecB family hemolysin secretion/activation protein [Fusobacterium sp. JB019]